MHDLGLGPPVLDEVRPGAEHKGRCYDGVYGCHICWNGANDGKGTVSECEWCKSKDVHTRIVKAWDEPCLYAICAACERSQLEELRRIEFEYADNDDWEDFEDG
jgi:hypothetical protein